jgi:hypothetical protein
MEDLFTKLILQAKESRKLISVYIDKDNIENFVAGLVKDIREDMVYLQSYDPNGFEDGVIVLRLADIYHLEYDNKYLKSLEKVIPHVDKIQKNTNNLNLGKNLVETLNTCMQQRLITSIKFIYSKGVTGYIKEVDDESVLIETITFDAEKDGISCVAISDIERIYFDGLDERRISFLLNYE